MEDRKLDQADGEEKQEQVAWGLISDEPFTPQDTMETLELIQLLRDEYKLFESEARSSLRQEVLGTLHKLLRKWIYEAALSKGQDESTAARAGCQIFTFGSYSLGVHGPNTDIDTL